MKKIKILQETPFHKAGTELSLSDFLLYYPVTVLRADKDEQLITEYLKNERELYKQFPNEAHSIFPFIGKFFAVVETFEWKVGDWLWHEQLLEAVQVIAYDVPKSVLPNEVSLNAANQYTNIYKRYATVEEIKEFDLVVMSLEHNDILVGKKRFYVKVDGVWKWVKNVPHLLQVYFKEAYIGPLYVESARGEEAKKCDVMYSGMQIACTHISHKELLLIAQIMEIPVKYGNK